MITSASAVPVCLMEREHAPMRRGLRHFAVGILHGVAVLEREHAPMRRGLRLWWPSVWVWHTFALRARTCPDEEGIETQRLGVPAVKQCSKEREHAPMRRGLRPPPTALGPFAGPRARTCPDEEGIETLIDLCGILYHDSEREHAPMRRGLRPRQAFQVGCTAFT